MSYKRYKREIVLSKDEKIRLLKEYIEHYKCLMSEHGHEVLNVKIPREVFEAVLDQIGSILNEKALEMANEDGPVKDFLEDNPLPPHMKELLPDDFRAFSLLLNAVKQWISAESQGIDRYLLGGTARKICKEAVDRCIVTKAELGEEPQLHHPLRDGRPPIILSKMGHELIERENQRKSSECKKKNESDESVWNAIKQIKSRKNQSWAQLREGCNCILKGSSNCRPGAKSFAKVVIKEVDLSASEILEMLDEKANNALLANTLH